MTEEDKLTTVERLGQAVGRTGHRPVEAIQEAIKSDPEKTEAFLRGAEAGQRERIERENQGQKDDTRKPE